MKTGNPQQSCFSWNQLASSFFFSSVVSVQTKIFKCFYWTSAEVWQEETCEHLTCRRHLLFLPPPPLPRPTGEPRSLLFWLRSGSSLQKNSSLAHLTVPPSSLLSGVYKITWQEDPAGVPQTFTDSSVTQEVRRFWTRRSTVAKFCCSYRMFGDKIVQLQNIGRPAASCLTGTTFGPLWFCIFMSCSWTDPQILSPCCKNMAWRHFQDNAKLLNMVRFISNSTFFKDSRTYSAGKKKVLFLQLVHPES